MLAPFNRALCFYSYDKEGKALYSILSISRQRKLLKQVSNFNDLISINRKQFRGSMHDHELD